MVLFRELELELFSIPASLWLRNLKKNSAPDPSEKKNQLNLTEPMVKTEISDKIDSNYCSFFNGSPNLNKFQH